MQNSTNISNSVEVFINTTTTADNLTTEEPTEKENITLVGHTVEKRDVNSTTQEGSTGESSTQATQAITRQENNGDKPKSLLSTHFSDVMTIIANETDLTERQNVSDASLIIAQVFPEILPTEDSTVVTTAPKLEKTLKIPADQLKLLQSVQNSFVS